MRLGSGLRGWSVGVSFMRSVLLSGLGGRGSVRCINMREYVLGWAGIGFEGIGFCGFRVVERVFVWRGMAGWDGMVFNTRDY